MREQRGRNYQEPQPPSEGPEEEEMLLRDDYMDEAKQYLGTFGTSLVIHLLLVFIFTIIVFSPKKKEDEGKIELAPAEEKEQEKKDFKPEEMEKIDVESPEKMEKVVKQPVMKNQDQKTEMDQNKEFEDVSVKKPKMDVMTESKQKSEVIGTQGGGLPGDLGGQRAGNKNLRAKGGSQQTEDAVMDALRWLARHQEEEGYWSVTGYNQQCPPDVTQCSIMAKGGAREHNVGITGLALLAFLGTGFTHYSNTEIHDPLTEGKHNFGEVVKKGLRWLKERQNENGAFAYNGKKYMYSHSVASFAYSEAYGMTQDSLLKEPAQKGINYLLAAQNDYSGWGYTHKAGSSDTSVTGWGSMALKSAGMAGLKGSKAGLEGAINWVEQATDEDYWCVGYSNRNRPVLQTACNKVATPKNKHFNDNPALEALGMIIRIFVRNDGADKNALKSLSSKLLSNLPTWKKGATFETPDSPIDYYYWYNGSMALFQLYGPGSPFEDEKKWKRWNKALKETLLPSQKGEEAGDEKGSWDPIGRWSYSAGRVYSTAINALTLQVYYRYSNAFTGR